MSCTAELKRLTMVLYQYRPVVINMTERDCNAMTLEQRPSIINGGGESVAPGTEVCATGKHIVACCGVVDGAHFSMAERYKLEN